MSIQVNNVTKTYGAQKALDNISFSIDTGQVIGFLGPNGAGKSTMMKIITGFLPPDTGNIIVEGINAIDNPLEIKRLIGYLPEHNPLYLEMYVKEYLAFVAGIYKLDNINKRVLQIIELTGLGNEQHKKIGELSKGYRQRVGLAQALVHNPKVLILDEPTSGLDPNQIIEIRNLIADAGKEKTVMLSTHIMQEVEAICQQIIIINNGVIVANNNTKTIQQLSNGKTIVISIEFNKPVSTNNFNLPDIISVKNLAGAAYIIEAKSDIREQLFSFAVKNQLSVLSMQKQELSLEQVFQKLTKK